MFSTKSVCRGCQKTVYAIESVTLGSDTYHRWCVKCSRCLKVLSISTALAYRGALYCDPHYKSMMRAEIGQATAAGDKRLASPRRASLDTATAARVSLASANQGAQQEQAQTQTQTLLAPPKPATTTVAPTTPRGARVLATAALFGKITAAAAGRVSQDDMALLAGQKSPGRAAPQEPVSARQAPQTAEPTPAQAPGAATETAAQAAPAPPVVVVIGQPPPQTKEESAPAGRCEEPLEVPKPETVPEADPCVKSLNSDTAPAEAGGPPKTPGKPSDVAPFAGTPVKVEVPPLALESLKADDAEVQSPSKDDEKHVKSPHKQHKKSSRKHGTAATSDEPAVSPKKSPTADSTPTKSPHHHRRKSHHKTDPAVSESQKVEVVAQPQTVTEAPAPVVAPAVALVSDAVASPTQCAPAAVIDVARVPATEQGPATSVESPKQVASVSEVSSLPVAKIPPLPLATPGHSPGSSCSQVKMPLDSLSLLTPRRRSVIDVDQLESLVASELKRVLAERLVSIPEGRFDEAIGGSSAAELDDVREETRRLLCGRDSPSALVSKLIGLWKLHVSLPDLFPAEEAPRLPAHAASLQCPKPGEPCGTYGKYLWVFLERERGSSVEEDMPPCLPSEYLGGGVGLAARIINDKILAVNPESSVVAIVPGLLTGSGLPESDRFYVVFTALDNEVPVVRHASGRGYFAVALKTCGYDGLFFVGKSRDPVSFALRSPALAGEGDKARFKSGVGELKDVGQELHGQSCGATLKVLGQSFCGAGMLAVGDSEDSLHGCLTNDGCVVSRGGVGAALRGINLRAVCIERDICALPVSAKLALTELRASSAARKIVVVPPVLAWLLGSSLMSTIVLPNLARLVSLGHFKVSEDSFETLTGALPALEKAALAAALGQVPLKNHSCSAEEEFLVKFSAQTLFSRPFAEVSEELAVRPSSKFSLRCVACLGPQLLWPVSCRELEDLHSSLADQGIDCRMAATIIGCYSSSVEQRLLSPPEGLPAKPVWGDGDAIRQLCSRLSEAYSCLRSCPAAMSLCGLIDGEYLPMGHQLTEDVILSCEAGPCPGRASSISPRWAVQLQSESQPWQVIGAAQSELCHSLGLGTCLFKQQGWTLPLAQWISAVTGWAISTSEYVKMGVRQRVMLHRLSTVDGTLCLDYARLQVPQRLLPSGTKRADLQKLRLAYISALSRSSYAN